MTLLPPVCINCKHFVLEMDNCHCKAFPKGIPVEIWENGNDHKKPLPDQGNDSVFEKKKQ